MLGFVMQDSITVRVGDGDATIRQSESAWLDLETARDAFVDFSQPISFAVGAPIVTKIRASWDSSVTLGRWLRWRLTSDGASNEPWGATFRVLGAANTRAA